MILVYSRRRAQRDLFHVNLLSFAANSRKKQIYILLYQNFARLSIVVAAFFASQTIFGKNALKAPLFIGSFLLFDY